MLFPISDDDRALTTKAYVTYTLLIVNALVFVLLQQGGMNETFTAGFSVVPEEIVSGIDLVDVVTISSSAGPIQIAHTAGPTPIYLTILTAMFMHGGIMHLAGNMLYLWIFGDNIEHRFGHRMFLTFYIAAGIVATATQIALDPHSVIPNLGASGAISGVMGAYIVLFPRNRVTAIFFFYVVTIPAFLALGSWILVQVLEGFGTFGGEQLGGVAYGAHIGGFTAGALMALLIRPVVRERPSQMVERAVPKSARRRLW